MKRSISETGHAVNIANFKLLADKCERFGAAYNPSNESVTVSNMLTLWTNSDAEHTTLIVTKASTKEPINQREILFEPLDELVTRVLRSLNSTKASIQVKADAKGIGDVIRGVDLTRPKPVDTGDGEVDTISRSHQSFVQRADRFKQLIELLKTVTDYKPNEPELKTGRLDLYYNQLKEANDNMGIIVSRLEKSLINRNTYLYRGEDCIIETAKRCKDYVCSLYGSTSAEFRMVSGISFRDMMPKRVV